MSYISISAVSGMNPRESSGYALMGLEQLDSDRRYVLGLLGDFAQHSIAQRRSTRETKAPLRWRPITKSIPHRRAAFCPDEGRALVNADSRATPPPPQRCAVEYARLSSARKFGIFDTRSTGDTFP